MKKMYLMKGMAVMAFGLVVASCNKMDSSEFQGLTEEQIKENAEKALGVKIDANQTWVMTQNVTANVDVDGDYDANYEVTIYNSNPFAGTAEVLGKGSVVSGNTASFKFTAPSGLTGAYAAIKDEKGYSYVKPVAITDGEIETAFGKGTGASSASRRSMITRGDADNFTIPTRTMPDLSAYIDDAVAITDENNTTAPSNPVKHYLIPEGTTWDKTIVLIQSASDASVYVQGTLNINAEQRVNGGCVFIVGPKGTVNIASGTQLVTNANNSASTVGSFYVYPGGKVQGEGTLQFANGTGSYNYNGGSIDVGTINNNGGTLYNAGTIETDVMQGGAGLSIYENAGKVHIGSAAKGSSTANTRIHNNCWWECDGELACRNIRQGQGAYIKAASLNMSGSEDGTGDAAYIWAKENSLVDIAGDVSLNNIDIDGPTTNDYAYIQFGKMTFVNYTGGWGQTVTVGAITNNIRLSVDTPEIDENIYNFTPYEKIVGLLNGAFADSDNPWAACTPIGNDNATLVQKGQYNIATVEESECSPGITPVTPTPVVETYPIYSYAFEDTKVGDYDMNDVVIKAQETEDGKINLTLVAVGATLDLNIRLYPAGTLSGSEVAHYSGNFSVLEYEGNTEVHAMLGVNKGTMTNTGAGATATPITIQIDKGSYDPAHLPLAIYSESQGEMRLAGSGQAPFGIIIPINWKWPTERVNITSAYNYVNIEEGDDQSFGTFANKAGEALNWYNYPTGSVMIK